MLAWFTTASLAIKIGIVVGILAAFFGFGWLVYHTLYHWGYDEAKAEDAPIIAKAKNDLANAIKDVETAQRINKEFQVEVERLHGLTVEQQVSIDKFKIEAVAAEIKVRKVLVDIAIKEKRYTAEIQRLLAIAAGPALTEGGYEEADSILRALVRDRMREPAGTTPVGGDAPAKGGTRRSGGSPPVR